MAKAYTVELTQQQVQDAVVGYFPVEQVTPFAKLTLFKPLVSLDQKSDRIGLTISVSVAMQGFVVGRGRATVDGDLEYRQKTGEFYLHDPKIRKLDVRDLPPEIAAPVRQGLQALMQQSLPVILVYKLKDDDIKQMIAKNVVTSVDVRNGKLIIELTAPVLN